MMQQFLLAIALVLAATDARAQSVVGDWNATLKVGASTLHWVLHIVQEKDGLSATLDSPDQGVLNVLVEPIEFKDRRLTFLVAVVDGSYEGILSEDGASIEGKWRQGDDALPLTFKRAPKPR